MDISGVKGFRVIPRWCFADMENLEEVLGKSRVSDEAQRKQQILKEIRRYFFGALGRFRIYRQTPGLIFGTASNSKQEGRGEILREARVKNGVRRILGIPFLNALNSGNFSGKR